MATGKTHHLGAIPAFSKVEDHSALGIGSVNGSNGSPREVARESRTSTVVLTFETERRRSGPTDSLIDGLTVGSVGSWWEFHKISGKPCRFGTISDA